MRVSKASIAALSMILIMSSSIKAEDLKAMAPSFDITGKNIEQSGQNSTSSVSVDVSADQKPNNKTDKDKKAKKADKKANKAISKTDEKEKKTRLKEDKAKQKEEEREKKIRLKEDKIKLKEEEKEKKIRLKEDKTKQKEEEKPKKENDKLNNQPKADLQQVSDDKNQLNEDELQQVDEVVEKKNAEIQEDIKNGEAEVEAVDPAVDSITSHKSNVHDSDIKKQAEIVELELRGEEKQALRDLRVLWSAAVEKSTSIRLSIQKLSDPDESDKVKQSALTKFLSPLANIAPMAMMASSSATQTAGALVGGSLLGTLSSDVDNNYNRAFLHVSDFDLIMLARAVDELQSRLVVAYYEYVHSIERLELAETALINAEKHDKEVKGSGNFAATTASDAFYSEAKQNQMKAKHNFLSARTALEQLTGNNAIVYIETNTDLDEEPEQPIDKIPSAATEELGANKVK